jgi:HPt (histidine-containing phosphotransfer) domain-containing protein
MSAVDITVLHALIGHDPAAVADVLGAYIQSMEVAAPELREAIATIDAPRVRAAAHRIKSPSLLIGAAALGDLSQRIEHAATGAEWPAIAELFRSFDRLFAQVQQDVVDHIRNAEGVLE